MHSRGKKQVTYDAVNQFIILIRCCAVDEIKRYLEQYDPIIVNRLQTQMRQPALYFAAILIDHQQSYEIMKLLIDHGANPKFEDNQKQTVLFYVCRQGKEKCLDLLLDCGLNLNEEDCFGQTPLFYAAKENRLNIIHKIIQRKADPNHVDKLGQQTPLFYAARQGHLQICKVLIEAGCDLSHQDLFHKVASHYAKKGSKNEVYQYLNNEYQNLKDQKKILTDSRQESNIVDDRLGAKKPRKKDTLGAVAPAKVLYRLFRSDTFGNSNEITKAEFDELLQNSANLKRLLQNPDQIDTTVVEQIKAKDAWIKAATKALTVCWKSKGGFYFQEPVDPSKYGIDDYFDLITQPMDFGTIKKKLTFNVYSNIAQFIRDMYLVFDNCVRYNGKENIIAKQAIQIKSIFQENLKQTGYMN